MKANRWISLLLVLMMSITLLGGCKSNQEEDFTAQGDSWVEVETPDDSEKDPAEEKDPEEEKKPEKEEAPKEEASKEETPKEEAPKEETPKEETPGEETPKEEKPAPVEKETSGTEITFLAQNIRHAGYRLGTKGDGTGNDIYNRLRRFKSLVKANKPDVIFINEARIGHMTFFDTDEYFAANYDVVREYDLATHQTDVQHQEEPLLYNKNKYKYLDGGYFWLNDNINQKSPGFNGKPNADNATWAKLQDKATGAVFYAYCNHFNPDTDVVGIPDMMVWQKIISELPEDAYAFVGGDYNVYYRGPTYLGMMEWDTILDLRDVAMGMYEDGLCQLGGMMSGHNLAYEADAGPLPVVNNKTPQIDYVMAKPHPNMAVDYYGFDYTIYDYPEDGVQKGHISDHFGLVVKVRIGTKADYSQYQQEEYDYGDHPIYFNDTSKE